jgi:hypothetical protein
VLKAFKEALTLVRNSRGCYILDTVKGCSIVNAHPRGCYDDCYAKGIADRYGLDFSRTVARKFTPDAPSAQMSLFDFKDDEHLRLIIGAIMRAPMPFVRIGEMGDPSWNWRHTLAICEKIKPAGKPIVIITKHWAPIPNDLLTNLDGICINTSVSALDATEDRLYRLYQYERLKPYCKSVLRIVSCDFNLDNQEGRERAIVQSRLFGNENVLDTVFRPSPGNQFLTRGVIRAEKTTFLKAHVLASVHNPKTYFGYCGACPEMCGVSP